MPSVKTTAQSRRSHFAPKSPMHRYFSRSRRQNSAPNDLMMVMDQSNFVGIYSPWAVLYGVIFLLVPISYLYIVMVLVRELFPHYLLWASETYVPILHQWAMASTISSSVAQLRSSYWSTSPDASQITSSVERQWLWLWIEVWCYLEALFYVSLKIHIRWLQCQDPLEASLSAAPLMELSDRAVLWQRMMATENPVDLIQGWFFDQSVLEIGIYDVREFCAWSMFEARHQEHLTTLELEQLEGFVQELQWRISLQLHGAVEEDDDEEEEEFVLEEDEKDMPEWKRSLPKPKKFFFFHAEAPDDEANFFSDLYESFRRRYDQIDFNPVQDLRNMVQKAGDNFHPVKDFRNLVAETAQHLAEVEESAMATASQTATQMYESLVPSGSLVDKQLTAMSHATYQQLQEAWNSVKTINQRLETARFLSKQRQRLRQQLKGYRVMLNRMRDMSSGVPSKQMAALMRRITECCEAMEHLEGRAQKSFVQATGFALKNLPFMQRKEPQRFAKYSSDPLLGLATYPLCLHLLLLGCTEIPLRIKLRNRGFERRHVGPVSYYYHPGRATEERMDEDDVVGHRTPIVFVHGIGIGLISYMHLIDTLLESGREIFLPEIPYVCGFRPWQSPHAVLKPAVVASTMTAMLATHGHLSAAWLGHSYGTSWLSYLVKYAPEAVASVLFLDPICFCLHVPRLTKSFVYSRPDPGTISYIIRTDVIVNWTIQRSFPWAWIILFAEQIQVPCSIFLSEKDALVPSEKIEDYLCSQNVPIQDFENAQQRLERGEEPCASKELIQCTVFRGAGHGEWTERPHAVSPVIAKTVEFQCHQVEQYDKSPLT